MEKFNAFGLEAAIHSFINHSNSIVHNFRAIEKRQNIRYYNPRYQPKSTYLVNEEIKQARKEFKLFVIDYFTYKGFDKKEVSKIYTQAIKNK